MTPVRFIKFSAEWCQPCKKYDPIINKVVEELGDEVDFNSVDIDEQPELARDFGVQSVPYNVFINPKDGEVLGAHVGALNSKQLKKVIAGFNETINS